jgi:hypothetical protein
LPDNVAFVPVWSQSLQAEPCGLSLAREKGWLLAWDQKHWIHLFNQAGQVQARARFPRSIAQCAIADDGSGAVAAGQQGELHWLAPDLTTRWQRALDNPLVAVAIDPFGFFLAATDTRGGIHLLDNTGSVVAKGPCPSPLRHVAFVPSRPLLVGCADYGLVGAFDQALQWRWREILVLNVGSMAVSGDGSALLLACFSDGIHHFDQDGKARPRLSTPEPCRLICQSFDGDRLLAAGMANQTFCMDRAGRVLGRFATDGKIIALAFGPLGESAYTATTGGHLLKLQMLNQKILPK